jgi:predicted ribosomally synthesized peptide with SipW-like signal peptide
MSLRKVAGLLIAFGLMVGLIGSGVGASFTDQASAVANIQVGTFAIQITSSTPGAVVDGTVGGYTKTVTLTCPTIQSSAAGSCPLQFTITNEGSMPANITVAVSTAPAAPFTDILGPVTPFVLAAGGHQDFAAGLQWPALDNSALGMATSITYTITATA